MYKIATQEDLQDSVHNEFSLLNNTIENTKLTNIQIFLKN